MNHNRKVRSFYNTYNINNKMAEVAAVDAAPVVVAPVAKEEVFAVAHIFASFNDTFVVS